MLLFVKIIIWKFQNGYIKKNEHDFNKNECLLNAFFISCNHGNLELIKWLLDIYERSNYGLSDEEYFKAIMDACKMNKYNTVKYLYNYKKGSFSQFGAINFNNMFFYACKNDNIKMAKLIYKIGSKFCRIDIKENFEELFLTACMNGSIKHAKWLYLIMAQNISPIRIRKKCDVAFHTAFSSGHYDIIKWLCSLYDVYSYFVLDGCYLCFINCERLIELEEYEL